MHNRIPAPLPPSYSRKRVSRGGTAGLLAGVASRSRPPPPRGVTQRSPQAGIHRSGPASTGEAPFRHGELVEPCAPHTAADRTHAHWAVAQRPGTHGARRRRGFPPQSRRASDCHPPPPLAPTEHMPYTLPSTPAEERRSPCSGAAKLSHDVLPLSEKVRGAGRSVPRQSYAGRGPRRGRRARTLRVLPKGGDGERGANPSCRSVMRTRCSAGPDLAGARRRSQCPAAMPCRPRSKERTQGSPSVSSPKAEMGSVVQTPPGAP